MAVSFSDIQDRINYEDPEEFFRATLAMLEFPLRVFRGAESAVVNTALDVAWDALRDNSDSVQDDILDVLVNRRSPDNFRRSLSSGNLTEKQLLVQTFVALGYYKLGDVMFEAGYGGTESPVNQLIRYCLVTSGKSEQVMYDLFEWLAGGTTSGGLVGPSGLTLATCTRADVTNGLSMLAL